MGQRNLSIKKTDTRSRLYADLEEATGEGTTSGAIDAAARYYLKMAEHGVVDAHGSGVRSLMKLAVEEGSVTPEQIADVLDTPELPVKADTEWSVGPEE